MNKNKQAQTIQLRIVVLVPPPGVQFAVQRGKSELLAPSVEHPEALQFDFTLRLGNALPDGSVNFLGEFAQGTPTDRFIYINSGTLAGQDGSCWTRRAKLKLAPVPREFVDAATSPNADIIQARLAGTMGDGSPICASVKPHEVEWSLVRDVAEIKK